jgi:hypothetical protein
MAAPKTGFAAPTANQDPYRKKAKPTLRQTNSGGNLPRPLLGKSLWLML